jgi:hypothetical protein
MKLVLCSVFVVLSSAALVLGMAPATGTQEAPTPLVDCGAEPTESTPNSLDYRIVVPCSTSVTALTAASLVGKDIAESWGCQNSVNCTNISKVCSGPTSIATGVVAVITNHGEVPPDSGNCGYTISFSSLTTMVECPCVDNEEIED